MTPALYFAGGTDEIGASSLILDIGAERLVIDAGLRHKAREGLRVPSWEPLKDKPPTAIVLTHAHLDHTGALPALHARFPSLPIYATRATFKLISLMLEDSLKIMALEEREGVEPLFTQPQLASALAHVITLDFNEPITLGEGEKQVSLCFEPAGHILGAAMLIARSQEGSVCVSGDVAATPQLSVPGASRRPLEVDTLVVESTYGGKTHPPRAREEERLIEQVKEALARGGSVLFPAFAIGRAQELILILVGAMERGELPFTPVYVDGLVRAVCSLYPLFPELLPPALKGRVERYGQPFWGGSSPVQPLWDPKKRAQVASDPAPKIIIASSGMLIGGPSSLYARLMASKPQHLIAITGYQDEESPGRAVQNLAREGGGELVLPDGVVKLRCQVGTYGLSAHSDTPQLLDLIAQSGAERVVLVHGDTPTRQALADALTARGLEAQVELPTLNEHLSLTLSEARRALLPYAQGVAEVKQPTQLQALSSQLIQDTARSLLERSCGSRAFSPQEVAYELGARGHGLSPTARVPVIEAMEGYGSPFKRHPRLSNTYIIRLDPTGELVVRGRGLEDPLEMHRRPRLDILATKALVKQAFEGASVAPYRVKFPHDQRVCELRFDFPEVARVACEDELAWLNRQLGGSLMVSPEMNHDTFLRLTLELLPPHWLEALHKNPSLYNKRREIVITLCLPSVESWAQAELEEGLLTQTGFKLTLELRPNLKPQGLKLPSDAPPPPPLSAEERLKAFPPKRRFLPSTEALTSPYRQTLIADKVRSACRRDMSRPKKLRAFKGHIEIVITRAQFTPTLRASLKALAEESGWPIAVELKG